MIKVVASSLFIVLIACTQVNSTGEKTITQGEDTLSEASISLSRIEAITDLADEKELAIKPILVFKASGPEPGWSVEIYETTLKLTMDYGKDSLVVEDSFKNIKPNETYSYKKEIIKNKIQTSLSLKIETKTCPDEMTGIKKDRTVLISYQGKEYKGCGSFIK